MIHGQLPTSLGPGRKYMAYNVHRFEVTFSRVHFDAWRKPWHSTLRSHRAEHVGGSAEKLLCGCLLYDYALNYATALAK